MIRFFQTPPLAAERPPLRGRRTVRLGSPHAALAAHEEEGGAIARRSSRARMRSRRDRLADLASARPAGRSAASSATTAARRSASRAASPATRRRPRTASTSGCSRWARASAQPLRPRPDGARAGTGRPPVLRRAPVATGAPGRASPGAETSLNVSCAKCGTADLRAGFPRRATLVGVHCAMSGGRATACGPSTRRPPTHAATVIATSRSAS